MPGRTLEEAVDELHELVVALHELIKRNRKINQRRWIIVVAMVPITFLLSFLGTIATVSTCFLGTDSTYPNGCALIPGYPESFNRQLEFQEEYARLVDITTNNSERLDRLERELRNN